MKRPKESEEGTKFPAQDCAPLSREERRAKKRARKEKKQAILDKDKDPALATQLRKAKKRSKKAKKSKVHKTTQAPTPAQQDPQQQQQQPQPQQQQQQFFVTCGRGMNQVVELEVCAKLHASGTVLTDGKVFFTSSCPPAALRDLRSVERAFVLVAREGLPEDLPSAKSSYTNYTKGIEQLTRLCASLPWAPAASVWQEASGLSASSPLPSFRVCCKLQGNRMRGYDPHDLAPRVGGELAEAHGWEEGSKHDVQGMELYVHCNDEGLVAGVPLFRPQGPLSARTYTKATKSQGGLRSTVAWSMGLLAHQTLGGQGLKKAGATCVDPMAGTGTVIVETKLAFPQARCIGGDISGKECKWFRANAKAAGLGILSEEGTEGSSADKMVDVREWDATSLPFGDSEVDCVVCDLPFGRKHGTEDSVRQLYPAFIKECERVLRVGGVCVLLTSQLELLQSVIGARTSGVWAQRKIVKLKLGALEAAIFVFVKAKDNTGQRELEKAEQAAVRRKQVIAMMPRAVSVRGRPRDKQAMLRLRRAELLRARAEAAAAKEVDANDETNGSSAVEARMKVGIASEDGEQKQQKKSKKKKKEKKKKKTKKAKKHEEKEATQEARQRGRREQRSGKEGIRFQFGVKLRRG